jgi:nitroimidazol reductase NimA-like FMN-containing flavoprotein (pyridoxamine 5'-phosphate oxidase superfamily)
MALRRVFLSGGQERSGNTSSRGSAAPAECHRWWSVIVQGQEVYRITPKCQGKWARYVARLSHYWVPLVLLSCSVCVIACAFHYVTISLGDKKYVYISTDNFMCYLFQTTNLCAGRLPRIKRRDPKITSQSSQWSSALFRQVSSKQPPCPSKVHLTHDCRIPTSRPPLPS